MYDTQKSQTGELPEGTKREILDLLVRRERPAAEIATRLGVSGTAVRQHLAMLAEAGLVERTRVASGRGRPAYLYRLSPLARREYPKRYDLLALGLVEALLEREGEEAALDMVEAAAQRLAERAAGGLPEIGQAGRGDRLRSWLEDMFAWEADWETGPHGGTRIVIHRCPFQDVAADHPAVCGRFLTALMKALADGGELVHVPIGDGIRCCALERSPRRRSIRRTRS